MANGSGQVPVIAIARESWVFFLQNWRMFLPAAGVTAVIAAFGPMFMMMSSGPAPITGAAAPSIGPGDFIAAIPGTIAGLLFAAVVLRKVVRDEFLGPTGLAFGADELRLLGVMAGLACIVIPFGTLVFVVVQVVVLARLAATPEAAAALTDNPEAFGAALETALGPAGLMAFTLFLMALLGAFLYGLVRLAMINAATIGERRMVMFQTWRLVARQRPAHLRRAAAHRNPGLSRLEPLPRDRAGRRHRCRDTRQRPDRRLRLQRGRRLRRRHGQHPLHRARRHPLQGSPPRGFRGEVGQVTLARPTEPVGTT